MTLQRRIGVIGVLLIMLVMVAGFAIYVGNARKAIRAELDSSAYLTIQLLDLLLRSTAQEEDGEVRADIIRELGALEKARHLCIGLYRQDGTPLSEASGCARRPLAAPAWFARFLQTEPVEFSLPVAAPGASGTILVRAYPDDEIDEAWRDIRDVAWLAIGLFIGANLLMVLIVWRATRPVNRLLAAIDSMERGDYRLEFPEFSLLEYRKIAQSLKRMAETLERAEREKSFLAQKSLVIQEQERRAIARELHDEMGQYLVAIRADAAFITKQEGGVTQPVLEAAQAILSSASRMYAVARGLMQRLRPAALDALGLGAALRQLVEEWSLRHPEVTYAFECQGAVDGLSDAANINIYRVVQESLTNIAKHAHATEVRITIAMGADGDLLQVRIIDNGVGFDPASVRSGLGLLGIRERISALGGKFSLNSQPGQYTRLEFSLPISCGAVAAEKREKLPL